METQAIPETPEILEIHEIQVIAVFAGSEYGCREMDFVTIKINMCTKLCSSAADCVIDGSVYTEENYECKNSTCVIRQCSSDQWCKDTMTEDYTCYE